RSLPSLEPAAPDARESRPPVSPNAQRPRGRRAAHTVLKLTNAAGPRRNGQPQAWQERSCDAVAAFSLACAARGRADAGTVAPKDEISRLDARAVFPREAALILVNCARD